MARIVAARPIEREQTRRMSYDDYLRQVDESVHAEWVDGEVTIVVSPTIRHQDIATLLAALLRFFLSFTSQGTALGAPTEMKLRAGRSYREPDVLVVLREHLDRFTAERLDGPADLVFELLSRESRERDRDERLREYEAAGVAEYWIVDATEDRTGVVAYGFDAAGRCAPLHRDDRGRIHSVVLAGFWLDPSWFSGDSLPNDYAVLRQLLPDAFA